MGDEHLFKNWKLFVLRCYCLFSAHRITNILVAGRHESVPNGAARRGEESVLTTCCLFIIKANIDLNETCCSLIGCFLPFSFTHILQLKKI